MTEVDKLPAAPPLVLEPEWRRVDVRAILVKPFNEILGFIPAVIGLVSLGHRDTDRLVWGVIGIGLFLLRGLLHWATTRYRVTEDTVELRTGLLLRQRFATNRDRVRTVEANARFGHRVFGVTAVRVGTGQHETTWHRPMTMDPVSKAEAERLRRELLRRAPADSPADSPVPDVAPAGERIAQLDWTWLRYAPLTLSGLAAITALIGLIWRLINDLGINVTRFGALRQALTWVDHTPRGTVVLIGIIAGLLVVLVGSVLVYAFQFAGYTLTREPDATLHVRRGLLTTSAVTIEEARMRGVEVSEPLLLRAAHGARCNVIATGLRHKAGNHTLMPPGPAGEAHRVAGAALRVRPAPTTIDLVRHPRRALGRRLVRAVIPVGVLELALWLTALAGPLPAWPWQVGLVLPPLAVLVGWDRYRNLGHGLTKHYLVSRLGSLDRRTAAVQRTGIIGWRIRRSFFQRRAGLLTLTAITAAGRSGYHVIDLTESAGLALADRAVPGILTPFLERR